MPATPTADRILRHGRRILDRHGAEAVTMRAVAKAVGITPMALYRHFPDRNGLLNAIADQGFAEYAALLNSSVILSEAERSAAKSKDLRFGNADAVPLSSSVILSEAKRSAAKSKDLRFGNADAVPLNSSVILSEAKRSAAKSKDLRFQSLEKSLDHLLDLNLDFALANPHLFELMFLRPRPGARQFPADFKAGASPTAGVATALFQRGIETGLLRRDDPWEMTFETGALLQGLVMLWIGGRFGGSPEEFRALCHRSFRRYINGIRK